MPAYPPLLQSWEQCYHITSVSTVLYEQPGITEKFRDSFYVDDLISGASDIQTALDFCLQSRWIMAAGGMSLCTWKSNSPELIQKIAMTVKSTTSAAGNVKEEDET